MVLPRIAGLTALQTINNTASGIIRADAQSYAVVVYQDTPVRQITRFITRLSVMGHWSR